MNKLYVFGCSHSAIHNDVVLKNPDMKKYYKYRGGNFPPTWSELVAKNLKLELVNTAVWGLDNYRIFEAFCNTVEKIKSGDTVVIGWSGVSRFSLYSEKLDSLLSVNAWSANIGNNFTDISKQTIEELLVNRDNLKWTQEVHSWIKAIEKLSKLIGFRVYFWSFFNEFRRFYITDDILKLGGEYIITETNGEVANYHLGEKGHIIQAHYVVNMLKQKYRKII